jgi:carboxylesterase
MPNQLSSSPSERRRQTVLRLSRPAKALYDAAPMPATRMPGTGDKSPIFALGKGPAVLCLHGFTGTPYEVAPLAHALASAGFSVSAPLLAGHGDDAKTLAATRWQDWLASAEQALDRLRVAAGDVPLAVAGFSMGGLLALRLARLRPRGIAALVIMSAPLRLRGYQVALARAWNVLPKFLRQGPLATIRKRDGSDVTDENARRENPSLVEMPIAGIVELTDLARIVRGDLSFLRLPTLVVHGERDRTVPPRDSVELAGGLASAVVDRLWLPRSGHLVAVDVERALLRESVVRFLTWHACVHPRASEILS